MIKLTKKRVALIITTIFAIIAATSFTAYALAPIWSQPSNPLTIANGSAYSGTLLPVTWNGTTIKTTDHLLISTDLNPAPNQPQTVTFFYTAITNPTPTTPVGTNPATSLVSLGTAVSSGNTASKLLNPTLPQGTFYLLAEIANPK